ncbi:MAG: aldose epimerase family protein [Terriglobia bacterium]
MANAQDLYLYTLTNSAGMRVGITNYGARIVSILAPDRRGNTADVAIGFDELDRYLSKNPYFGAIVGRYGNRIAKGKFILNGVEYSLPTNGGPNSLHGGTEGFDKRFWTAQEPRPDHPSVELSYFSPDGEESYPGDLSVKVAYTLTDDSGLRIEYTAATDKDTVINLTNHTYFNLAGEGNGSILGQEMMLNASQFTPIDASLIPTGELRRVEGTPLDFRKPIAIGQRIEEDDPQLKFATWYDHNYVLDRGGPGLALAARAFDPDSGRVLEVLTTQPGVQFYTGNFLDGTISGKGGKAYTRRSAFCLETQHFPDSPNHPNFPSTVLKPGGEYRQTTIFKFSTV